MIFETDSSPGVVSMEISELLDAAKDALEVPSDLQLSAKIGSSSPQISRWRKGHFFPQDSTIADICELAGYPTDVGLLWLNVWRADEKAKPIYEKLARDAEKRASKSRKAA